MRTLQLPLAILTLALIQSALGVPRPINLQLTAHKAVHSRQKRQINEPDPLVEEIKLGEWENVSDEGVSGGMEILVSSR